MRPEEILGAFLSGRGRWTGCDWPTRFGAAGLNLCTVTASQALLLARATAGDEAAEWRAATAWLRQVEEAARQAEAEAGHAARLAAAGRLAEAAERARAALALEENYRPAVVWQPLYNAVIDGQRRAKAAVHSV
jgi:hypothetical protein